MALDDGRTVVTTAGTRVQLSAVSVPARSVVVTAETDNTGIIVVGGPAVVAALATRRGTPLSAGDSIQLSSRDDAIDDLNQIWLDSTVSTDGVTFQYAKRR